MVGVTGFADAQEINLFFSFWFFHQRECRRLTDRYPVTRDIKRTTGSGGRQLECMEAIQRRQTQRVDSADNGGIDHASVDHAASTTKHFGAGRAR